jgi:hypothetical protein
MTVRLRGHDTAAVLVGANEYLAIMLQATVQQLKCDNALWPSGCFARAELREQGLAAHASALFGRGCECERGV